MTPPPHAYIELAYFHKTARMMREMAIARGLADQAAQYRDWAETMRANFRQQHLQPDGSIQPGSQTAYVLALDCGLLTGAVEREKAGAHLAALIRKKSGPKNSGMTTGFLGTEALLPVLADTGQLELAATILQSRRYPSWGYAVKNGATTIWERWNSLYRGTRLWRQQRKNERGHEFVLPEGAEPVPWVRPHHDSPHGRIAVSWKRDTDDSLLYKVSIPPNTTARLTLPRSSPWKNDAPKTATTILQPGTHQFHIR